MEPRPPRPRAMDCYDVHDDDIAVDMPCAWVEANRHNHLPTVIPSTIDKVRRDNNGFVSSVHARSETGDFGRTFARHANLIQKEPFVCGAFLLILGTRMPSPEQIIGIREWWDRIIRDEVSDDDA